MKTVVILILLTLLIYRLYYTHEDFYISCPQIPFGFQHNHKDYHEKCMKETDKIPCHFKKKNSKELLLGRYNPEIVSLMGNQTNPYKKYEDGEFSKYFKKFIYAHRIPYLNKLKKNENYEVKFVWHPQFNRIGYTNGVNKNNLYKVVFFDDKKPKSIDNVKSLDIEFQDENPKFYMEQLNKIKNKVNEYTKLDI